MYRIKIARWRYPTKVGYFRRDEKTMDEWRYGQSHGTKLRNLAERERERGGGWGVFLFACSK